MRLRAPYKVEQGKCEFIDVRCAHRTPSPIISSNAPLPRLDLSGNLCNKRNYSAAPTNMGDFSAVFG